MNSIRSSLTVCFLALLGLALGLASLLAYGSACANQENQLRAQRELVERRFQEKSREEETRRDEALLNQAQTIARLVQYQVNWGKFRFLELYSLGLLSIPIDSNAYAMVPLWGLQSTRNFANEMYRRATPTIRFDQDELFHRLDGQVAEFFQVQTAWGSKYRSLSLGDHSLPIRLDKFPADDLFHWIFEDETLSDSLKVRKVTLKVSRFLSGPYTRTRGASIRVPPLPPSPPNEFSFRPTIYVQCAFDLAKTEGAIAGFGIERDAEVHAYVQEQAQALKVFRDWLIGINLLTFVVGGSVCLWVVKVGLEPLRILAAAVSRVSENEFRLDANLAAMPSELKPIMQRLESTFLLLQKAFNREKQATADITHELRTPVAAMLTTLDVSLRKSRSVLEYQGILQELRASCKQMHSEVERLLTLARLDAGADPCRPELFDLATLCNDCVRLIYPLSRERSIEVTLTGESPMEIKSDPGKLREILINLLHNAIHYNHNGGRVDLSFAARPGSIVIEVRDNGLGIRPENHSRIFERFYREDPSRVYGDGTSSGLGLAIVKGFVDVLGGAITMESTHGKGSAFKVVLPAPIGRESGIPVRA